VRGGRDGTPAGQYKVSRNGDRVDLPNVGVVTLETGERIVSQTTGGGGYGAPTERDPEMVRRDVAEGYISAERAQEIYGVVLDGSGNVDVGATATQRAQ